MSQYIAPEQIARAGPARVLLGSLADAHSAITPPSAMNYLALTLAPGASWRYQPPAGHVVADEQTAIATILSDMDTEIAALEAKLTKTRQLKQGMMAELLTGRTRLV